MECRSVGVQPVAAALQKPPADWKRADMAIQSFYLDSEFRCLFSLEEGDYVYVTV